VEHHLAYEFVRSAVSDLMLPSVPRSVSPVDSGLDGAAADFTRGQAFRTAGPRSPALPVGPTRPSAVEVSVSPPAARLRYVIRMRYAAVA
jgi:hypothetical protein